MQQRKPVAQVKMKNLINGKVLERNFQNSERFEEAEIENKPVKYLFSNKGEFWFCEPSDPSKRFKIDAEVIGQYGDLMKANSLVDAIVFEEKVIGIKMPAKVELKVVEAPPSTKGNTAQGGSKQVKLETGATINVPLFIEQGDVIRINTESKQYTERADKGKF
jgi:elongation factor P